MTERAKDWLVFSLIVLLPLLCRASFLFGWQTEDPSIIYAQLGWRHNGIGTPWVDPNVGLQAQALGKLAADQWLSGHVPWWNPYNGVGLPLAAEIQPGVFFFPFIFLYHFRDGLLWNALIFQIIAGFCTFRFLSVLGLMRRSCLLGALLFELCGTFAWFGQPGISPLPFLPMLLWALESSRAQALGGSRPKAWFVAVALVFSVLSGFPETAYINGLFAGLWVFARLDGMPAPLRKSWLGSQLLALFMAELICAPQIGPFMEYMGLSYKGQHEHALAHMSLPSPSVALFLFPGILGPIFSGAMKSSSVWFMWGNIGGYVSCLQLFLVAVFWMRLPRKLGLVLFGWSCICLVKAFDLRPLSDLVNVIPLVQSANFVRYCVPSIECMAIFIIAFGCNDLYVNGLALSATQKWMGALCGAVAVAALIIAFPLWNVALQVTSGLANTGLAIVWGLLSLALGMFLLARGRRGRWLSGAVMLLLLCDGLFNFMGPLRAAPDQWLKVGSGLEYLEAHAGLQRVNSVYVIQPNYGAYFGFSQIQHNYLPVSKNWIDYIHANLQSSADGVSFDGDAAGTDTFQEHVDKLLQRLPAYEFVGVNLLAFAPDVNPFVHEISNSIAPDNASMPLVPGKIYSLQMKAGVAAPTWSLRRLDVTLLREVNAEGVLQLKVCVDVCNEQLIKLAQIPIGSEVNQGIALDLPLKQVSSADVSIQIIFSGTGGLSIVGMMDPLHQAFTPRLRFDAVDTRVQEAYAGPDMRIFRLLHARPYFEADGGPCQFSDVSRLATTVNCTAGAKVLRREAYYPGWSATLDGARIPVTEQAGLFQQVTVPGGIHRLVFSYQPTYLWLWLSMLVMGLVLLLVDVGLAYRRRGVSC